MRTKIHIIGIISLLVLAGIIVSAVAKYDKPINSIKKNCSGTYYVKAKIFFPESGDSAVQGFVTKEKNVTVNEKIFVGIVYEPSYVKNLGWELLSLPDDTIGNNKKIIAVLPARVISITKSW